MALLFLLIASASGPLLPRPRPGEEPPTSSSGRRRRAGAAATAPAAAAAATPRPVALLLLAGTLLFQPQTAAALPSKLEQRHYGKVLSLLQTASQKESGNGSRQDGGPPSALASRLNRTASQLLRTYPELQPVAEFDNDFTSDDQEFTEPAASAAASAAAAAATQVGKSYSASVASTAPAYVRGDNLHDGLGDPKAPLHPNQHASGAETSAEQNAEAHESAFGDSSHEGGHGYGYMCLAWMFSSLFIGCMIQMTQERFLPKTPYTCLLFLTGLIMALIHHAHPMHHWSTWPTWFISVEIWTTVNPHLIFYIFLPALIFAEAMKLNIKLAQDVFPQVLMLACPGVIFGAVFTALFARYVFPYDWSWPAAMVFGSILAATDPVAVVSLFSTLGVSPRLTMLVSGESLLNDGTAIVLFTLMLKVMLGVSVSFSIVFGFLLRMIVVSVLLGVAFALCGLLLLAWCSESNYHSDTMIQVVITIATAFLCFFVAETECATSGVLTLVSAGCMFSYVAWPRFVSRETVLIVWEAVEFVGNTMIFLLAGLLWGHEVTARVVYLHWSDLGWLILLYIAVTLIRAVMIFSFWPLLNRMGRPVTLQECIVIVWSGLRGAVGLVLAMVVDLEPSVDKQLGSQMLFHVGGVAMLSIVLNATTCAPLLWRLGLAKMPEVEEQTTAHFEKETQEQTRAEFEEIMNKSDDPRFTGAKREFVQMLVPAISKDPKPQDGRTSVDLSTKLQVYRETFMRVVRQHYWNAIEGGLIPRTSRVARVLLYSTDVGIENAKESLNDWDVVNLHLDDKQVLPTLNRWCELWPLSRVPPLQQLFPSSFTMMMWRVYASLSFIEAHRAAQEDLPKHFGAHSILGKQIQDEIARESNMLCDQADKLLKNLPHDIVEVGKSRMLAGRLLQLQLEKAKELQERGILSQKAASKITHRIHDSRRTVAGEGMSKF